MTKPELVALINLCYEAVEESKCGPLQGCEEGSHYWSTLSLRAFEIAFGALMPRCIDSNVEMREPKEPWQGEDNPKEPWQEEG